MLPRWRARLRLQRLSVPCPPLSSTYLHTSSLHLHRRRTGRWRGSLRSSARRMRVELRGSTRLLLLEGASSHTRAPNRVKFSKFAKLVVRFTRSPRPVRTLLPYSCSQIVPPFFIILPRLRRHGILLRKKHRYTAVGPGVPVCQCVDLMQTKTPRDSTVFLSSIERPTTLKSSVVVLTAPHCALGCAHSYSCTASSLMRTLNIDRARPYATRRIQSQRDAPTLIQLAAFIRRMHCGPRFVRALRAPVGPIRLLRRPW